MGFINPLVVNCYYFIFVAVAWVLNGLLIYLIKYRSPYIVGSMKAMLINTSSVQVLVALMASFLQGRMLYCTSSTALLPVGPCRLFGPLTCFVSYNVITALIMYVELLILHTMFCRYRMLQSKRMKTKHIISSFVIIGIFPVILLILPHVGPLRFDIVMKEAIREYPDYNLQNYGEFGGFKSTKDPSQAISSILSLVTAIVSPILMIYLRRLILKTLDRSQQQYAEKTVHSSKMFLQALTVQAMVPIICYFPMGFLTVIIAYTGTDVFMEYLIIALITLPCVVEPLCGIYFVPSYRAWVKNKFRERFTSVKVHSQATTVTDFQGPSNVSKGNPVNS